MAKKEDPLRTPIDLGHPIYLDIEMLLTFLAALEDGVAHSSEVAIKVAESQKNTASGTAGIKLPSLTTLLGLGLNAEGKLNRERGEDESVESKMVRQHTSASLFNRLRQRLQAENAIRYLRKGDDLDDLEPGALVEITGVCEENPLLRAVEVMSKLYPFIKLSAESNLKSLPKYTSAEKKDLTTMQVQQREEAIKALERQVTENEDNIKFAETIREDLRSVPIVDLVMRTADFSAIVSAGRQYFTDEFVAGLKDGTFKLLGKVNSVNLDENVEIPVTRRGGMAVIATALDNVVEELRTVIAQGKFSLELPDTRLRGRYVQVVPLAIYI